MRNETNIALLTIGMYPHSRRRYVSCDAKVWQQEILQINDKHRSH